MCCTTSTGSGKSLGRAPITRARAGGPPVEAPIPRRLGARPGSSDGEAWGRMAPRPAHSVPIGRRRITGTCAMIRSCVQISPATAS